MDENKVLDIVRSFVRQHPMVGTNVRDWKPESFFVNHLTNKNFNSLYKLRRDQKEYEKVIDINAGM